MLARPDEDAEALLHRADTTMCAARRARADARQARVRQGGAEPAAVESTAPA